MMGRVEVEGRHLRLNGERFVVKGTAYGPCDPRTDGARYPEPARLGADLESIAATGLNTIRTFDVPPEDLLSGAAELGLRVLVGLDYPDWRFEPFPDSSSARRVTVAGLDAVDRLFERVDDPSVILAVSVGQALSPNLVRVHHPAIVADTLSSIIDRVHTLDPSMPATYTGRADGDGLGSVDGCDLLSIVVDPAAPSEFERDLDRLHRITPAIPVVVTDLDPPAPGPMPRSGGANLGELLGVVDRAGCAGATVSTRARQSSLETWARRGVKDLRSTWPRITAVVHAHDSESTIERCLSALEMSDYHDLEVIICDQESTDRTAALARRYPFAVLPSGRDGGSSRRAGLAAASGEIVAFIDADVVCHSAWPWFLALAFEQDHRVAAVIPHVPAADATAGPVARSVAALAGIGRLPSGDLPAAIIAGAGALAVRRSAVDAGDMPTSGSAVAVDAHLIARLGDDRDGEAVGFAPAAQTHRSGPDSLGAVWREAVERGRADRQASELGPTSVATKRRATAELISSPLTGEWPPRPIAVRTLLDVVVPLLAAAAIVGAVLSALGAVVEGLSLTGASLLVALTLAAIMARDVGSVNRRSGASTIGPAVAAIVLLEPLANAWGRAQTTFRPPPPTHRVWTGHRDDWLRELRWRLRLERLSVAAPSNRSRWDIEVRCGLFLRRLIVTAIAWQWTPHVRTALRPRRLLAAPLVLVATIWLWSPMVAALIASATVGELAFELVTLRRVDGVITRSIAGSLPLVESAPKPDHDVELAARTTLEL